jgi:uncharacterized protein (DUF1800 family)
MRGSGTGTGSVDEIWAEAGAGRRAARLTVFGAVAALVVSTAGCGGGGGGGGPDYPPGADVPATAADAARFLTQATFGPRLEDIDFLSYVGYATWFEDQRIQKLSLQRPYLEKKLDQEENVGQDWRVERWWHNALLGPDQLRQRVAFALSEILVVSDVPDNLVNDVLGCAEYYDVLVRGAFGNYRALLEDVSKSPAMGKYLSHLQNQKAVPEENIHPDENYAREVMQLFSIGLVELADDGTVLLDAGGAPIPTYDQAVVEALARVFTGWTWGDTDYFWEWSESYGPMQNFGEYHDADLKSIVGGSVLPAGQTGEADLDQALDVLFQHENVGPFIGRQLIQRLVTSNPSAAYVQRVAAVFADDGSGERGDLFEVVKAILMDPEARAGHLADPEHFGKVKEPLLRITGLWRALDAGAQNDKYWIWGQNERFGQQPGSAPSVFNFFQPTFAPPGEIAGAGLVAPEMQIVTHTKMTATTNHLYYATLIDHTGSPYADSDTIVINIKEEKGLAADVPALIDRFDLLLMAGSMSSEMRQIVTDYVEDVPLDDDGTNRVIEALYLIVTSPEAAVQE